MRINLSEHSTTKNKPRWFEEMQREFAAEYDMRFGSTVKQYCATPPGARAFAAYLRSAGYRVDYWCLEPLVTKKEYDNNKVTVYLAFGLAIDESCPRFIEKKLKFA